ncbi:hypothetical protein BO94DRAFT_301251 [Aspergillus sclerotioniger CBS 115572]|uniref:Uncharacterized protein n=1 Tax=Aspergillus sclerotioniger CBS 115572 TaxID=1450535 RepID=A0A317V3C6_9EURO|nr:hypothetical protein BO94DRAFT_301251 [Aspergillus sclerotioniger CBS 115572]PWY68536.1 hypothetical protein BO94DRAFT_301251 [Aspergillus sclerotioniger CBS 115572]
MKRKAVPRPGGGGPMAELDTTTDSEDAPRRASVHLGAVDTASSPFQSKVVEGISGNLAGDRHADKHEQQQELLGDSGTSRIQVVINGAPLAPLAGTIPERQSRGPGSGQSRDANAATATAGSEDADPEVPPAVFVQRRRGSVQPSISSLGTHDAAAAAPADPPLLLALNAPAASSSLSLPSFPTPDLDMTAQDYDRGPLGALFGRHPTADHSRKSSVSSLAPSRQTHLQSQDSTPHARLAAMKMKYGDKIRDIRRISLGPPSPSSDQKPTLRTRLSGFLRPKSRGTKQASRPNTPIQPSKSASLSHPIPPSGHARFYSLDHATPNASSNLTALPRIPTPDSFRQAQNQPIVLPHASTPRLPSPSPVSGDYFSPSIKAAYHPTRSPHNGSPERGRSASQTYVQDLHLRSRSPNESAPRPEETILPNTDETDPAIGLGRFAHNPRTSRVGDQELPWKLSIPGLGSDVDEHEENGLGYRREKPQLEFTAVVDTAATTTTTDEKHHSTPPNRSPSPRIPSPSPSPRNPLLHPNLTITHPPPIPPNSHSRPLTQIHLEPHHQAPTQRPSAKTRHAQPPSSATHQHQSPNANHSPPPPRNSLQIQPHLPLNQNHTPIPTVQPHPAPSSPPPSNSPSPPQTPTPIPPVNLRSSCLVRHIRARNGDRWDTWDMSDLLNECLRPVDLNIWFRLFFNILLSIVYGCLLGAILFLFFGRFFLWFGNILPGGEWD